MFGSKREKPSKEEFYKVLNYLLLIGHITFDQYTQIELNTLPYL